MAKKRNIEVVLEGPLFAKGLNTKMAEVIHEEINRLGRKAAEYAKAEFSAVSASGRFVDSIEFFPSRDHLYAGVRSRNYGRPWRSRWKQEDRVYSTLLERGLYGGERRRRGRYYFKKAYKRLEGDNGEGAIAAQIMKLLS